MAFITSSISVSSSDSVHAFPAIHPSFISFQKHYKFWKKILSTGCVYIECYTLKSAAAFAYLALSRVYVIQFDCVSALHKGKKNDIIKDYFILYFLNIAIR